MKHEFFLVDKSDINKIIYANKYRVDIPEYVIFCMKDTLSWISSIWNAKKRTRGLNYCYGFSIIEERDITKLVRIIDTWRGMFQLAPEFFIIHGSYQVDNCSYEKIEVFKEEVVSALDLLLSLCKKALDIKCNILHICI